jgi:hypothetical protein
MSEAVPEFSGLSLSKIGDLGVQAMQVEESPPPAAREIEQAAAKRTP